MKKKILSSILIIFISLYTLVFSVDFGSAASSSSTNFQINNPIISSGQQNSSSTNFKAGQSVYQSVTGKASSTNFQLWSGFQYFFKANTNTLTTTAGDSEVDLSWSVPQTFLGITVGSYELGVGTISGTYTYENVGNVTTFTKTGLSNSTQYYFKIKSKTLGGTVLTHSNESSATPSSSTSPTPGGGGGGSGNYGTGQIIFKGTAYPNSEIFLLKDASLVGSVKTDSSGNFQISSTGLSAGTFEFSLYAKDPQGIRSALSLSSTSLSPNETKSIQDIVISPTISTNNLEVKQGEFQNIFGFAQKQVTVTIYLNDGSNLKTYVTQSNQDGFYNFNLPTANLNLGRYTTYSKSFYNNINSPNSSFLEFIVGKKTIQSPNFNGCPARGDLNGDCRVDLIDFSILAFWYLKPNFPAEIDFNIDGVVDLIDFSILAYNWTG